MNAWSGLGILFSRTGEDWDHWWLVAPFMWALWIAVVAGVIWLVVRRRRPVERSGIERARDILAERYARGELSGAEYRERLGELQ